MLTSMPAGGELVQAAEARAATLAASGQALVRLQSLVTSARGEAGSVAGGLAELEAIGEAQALYLSLAGDGASVPESIRDVQLALAKSLLRGAHKQVCDVMRKVRAKDESVVMEGYFVQGALDGMMADMAKVQTLFGSGDVAKAASALVTVGGCPVALLCRLVGDEVPIDDLGGFGLGSAFAGAAGRCCPPGRGAHGCRCGAVPLAVPGGDQELWSLGGELGWSRAMAEIAPWLYNEGDGYWGGGTEFTLPAGTGMVPDDACAQVAKVCEMSKTLGCAAASAVLRTVWQLQQVRTRTAELEAALTQSAAAHPDEPDKISSGLSACVRSCGEELALLADLMAQRT